MATQCSSQIAQAQSAMQHVDPLDPPQRFASGCRYQTNPRKTTTNSNQTEVGNCSNVIPGRPDVDLIPVASWTFFDLRWLLT